MPDAEYHDTRAAQERAIAASCSLDEARQLHLEAAAHHEERARLIRSRVDASPMAADGRISATVAQSRELIRKSYRLLAESRRNVPTESSSGSR